MLLLSFVIMLLDDYFKRHHKPTRDEQRVIDITAVLAKRQQESLENIKRTYNLK